MPEIRPFRALRYEPDVVGDLGRVVSPPYDVISSELQRVLLARHPKNVVRLDLPAQEPGDQPDDRYRRAARTFATWRSDGTFHKDPRPSLYVYEQTYRVPGTALERTQRGFFGRLRLEPFGSSGVRRHERTLSGPKEDRYRLLRATGANFSPIAALYSDPSGRAAAILGLAPRSAATADVTDDDGVRHRLWSLPANGAAEDGPVAELIRGACSGPITIADGHHRYETALRYRDERRMTRSCEEDPAFDYVLTLFLETAEPLTILPTHRVVRGLGEAAAGALLARAEELFATRKVGGADELRAAFGPGAMPPGGRGRIGLWTRSGGAVLDARPEHVAGLDVAILGIALERLCGIDPEVIAQGARVGYTKSVDEAVAWVDGGVEGADAAFLVEPTPIADVLAVADAGEIMPQKSTWFYPKPLSGLVINPHEW